MYDPIIIGKEALLQQVKLSAKIPELVEGIVSRQIINKTAEDLKIEITTAELQQAADEFRARYNLYDCDETYKWLEKHGISVSEFEEMIHYNLVALKLVEVMFQDKVEAYFTERQSDYWAAKIYEVILKSEDLAMELFWEIESENTSFHEIACQYIQDPKLKHRGGYRGTVYRKDLKPELCIQVFAANPPQLLKPIATSLGSHLIWVREIIYPQLDSCLSSKISSDLFNQWLSQMREEVGFELAIA